MCPLLLAWRAPAIQISSVFWTHLQQYTTVPQYRYESDQIQTPNSTSQKAKWNIANTRHPGGPRFVVLYFAVWISSLYLDHSKGINWRNVHVFRLSRQFSIKTIPQDWGWLRLRSLDSGYHTWCKTPLNWYVLFFFRQKVCFTYHSCLSGASWPRPPMAFSQLCLFNEQSSTWSNLQGSCPHLPGEARGTCATRQPQFLLPLRFLTLKLLISPLSQTFSFKETIQLHNEYMPLDSIYFAYSDF